MSDSKTEKPWRPQISDVVTLGAPGRNNLNCYTTSDQQYKGAAKKIVDESGTLRDIPSCNQLIQDNRPIHATVVGLSEGRIREREWRTDEYHVRRPVHQFVKVKVMGHQQVLWILRNSVFPKTEKIDGPVLYIRNDGYYRSMAEYFLDGKSVGGSNEEMCDIISRVSGDSPDLVEFLTLQCGIPRSGRTYDEGLNKKIEEYRKLFENHIDQISGGCTVLKSQESFYPYWWPVIEKEEK